MFIVSKSWIRCFLNWENGVRRGKFTSSTVIWGGVFQRTPTRRRPFGAAWRNWTDVTQRPMAVHFSSIYWEKGNNVDLYTKFQKLNAYFGSMEFMEMIIFIIMYVCSCGPYPSISSPLFLSLFYMVYTATKIVPRKIGSDPKVWLWKVVNCLKFDSVVEHVTCVGENLTNHILGSLNSCI